MSEADLEVLRDQYDAVNKRDWAQAMSHYADDVRLSTHKPLANEAEGIEAVGQWFGDWFSSFGRDLHFDITELTELDDGRILLIADHQAVGRASGVEVNDEFIWAYRLRDGKITEVVGHETREQAVSPQDPR